MAAILKSLLASLADVFRHILPGFVVLAFARLCYPQHFESLDLSKTAHVWAAIAGALLVGNVFYVLHRTIVHQAIDWAVSFRSPTKYVAMVVDRIKKHFTIKASVRDYMRLRNSQIIFTAMFGEICIAASIWHDAASPLASYPWTLRLTGVVVWLCAIAAHFMSQRLDEGLAKARNA